MSKSSLLHTAIALVFVTCLTGAAHCQSSSTSGTANSTAATANPTPVPEASYSITYTGRLFGYFRYPEVQEIGEQGCPVAMPTTETAPEAFGFLVWRNHTRTVSALKSLQWRIKEVAPADEAVKKVSEFLRLHSTNPVTEEQLEEENTARDDLLADLKSHNSNPRISQFLSNVILVPPLVAVGDNFAPFLLARRVLQKNSQSTTGQSYPPRLLPKEYQPSSAVPYDNVACFMRLAHFAAVVPGKHDFYFGPQRLRDIEGFLNAAPSPDNCVDEPCYTPVRMLGANITLKVQRTAKGSSDGGSNTKQSSRPNSAFKTALPRVVLPWMRSLNISAVAGRAGNISTTSFSLVNEAANCASSKVNLTPSPENDQARGVFWLESNQPLCAWVTYRIIAHTSGKQDEEVDSFTVAQPFFTQGNPWATATVNGQTVAIFGVVDPDMDTFVGRLNYTWLGLKNGSSTDLDPSYETIVNVGDPAEALNQALQLCSVDTVCSAAPKVLLAQMPEGEVHQDLLPFVKFPKGTRAFDVVMPQADVDEATTDRTSTVFFSAKPQNQRSTVLVPGSHFYSPSRFKDSSGARQGNQFCIGGPEASANPYCLFIRLQTAVVISNNSSRTVDNIVAISSQGVLSDPLNNFQPPLGFLQGSKLLADEIKKRELAQKTPFEDKSGLANSQQWQMGLEEISLRIMQRACHSDIAMLQHRDVFYDKNLVSRNLSDEGLAAVIGAIFWKGDFVQCVNVTGQTITSMLQRSAELERAENAGQFTDLSQGWSLAYTGIEPADMPGGQANGSQKTEWLVHGEFLDPKRLYSVAITDYLANGDTGYPDLQNAEPDPQIALADLTLRGLTDTLVAGIRGESAPSHKGGARDILDTMNAVGNAPPRQNQDTFLRWAGSWSHLNVLPSTNKFDSAEQQLPTQFLRLYKLDFSYALFQHNVSETALGSQFPGVTAVDLSNPDSESFSIDWQLRWQHDWKKWAYYSETDANFGRRNQRKQNGPYQPSQSANVWYLETGGALRLYPRYQNPSGFKFILPMSVKSQLVPPYTQVTNPNAKSSGGSGVTPISAPINFYLAFRPGFRFEHNFPRTQNNAAGGGAGGGSSSASASTSSTQGSGGKGQGKGGGQQSGGQGQSQSQSSTLNSYIEGGFEAGEVFRSPSAFIFCTPNTAVPPSCVPLSPIDIRVLPTGLAGLPPTAQLKSVVGDRDFYQQGVYLNARIDAPLPGHSSGEYIMENRGDFFFKRSSDAPVDVRLLDDWKHTLQFPIFSKITIGPSVEFIFFKTKVTGNYYFSYSTSVSLNYSFDWHPGLSWGKVLRFGSSLSAPNPLPTK